MGIFGLKQKSEHLRRIQPTRIILDAKFHLKQTNLTFLVKYEQKW